MPSGSVGSLSWARESSSPASCGTCATRCAEATVNAAKNGAARGGGAAPAQRVKAPDSVEFDSHFRPLSRAPGAPPAAGQNYAAQVCQRLEAQLATIDRGASGDPARAEQLRRYEEASSRQQGEV